MSENIKVFNYNSKGKLIDPKKIIINEKIIYEIIKKYIKELKYSKWFYILLKSW